MRSVWAALLTREWVVGSHNHTENTKQLVSGNQPQATSEYKRKRAMWLISSEQDLMI